LDDNIYKIILTKKEKKMRFEKYKQNLRKEGDYIISYTTKVARINRGETHLTELGIWSATTTRHINYAAKELGLTLINYKSKK
jgi:hypothetical protein